MSCLAHILEVINGYNSSRNIYYLTYMFLDVRVSGMFGIAAAAPRFIGLEIAFHVAIGMTKDFQGLTNM